MRAIYTVSPSERYSKKYKVIAPDGRILHFGARGYDDYTMHKNAVRMHHYLLRHETRENWNNLKTAGAWARWLLWNKPDFKDSARDMERRFNIIVNIVY